MKTSLHELLPMPINWALLLCACSRAVAYAAFRKKTLSVSTHIHRVLKNKCSSLISSSKGQVWSTKVHIAKIPITFVMSGSKEDITSWIEAACIVYSIYPLKRNFADLSCQWNVIELLKHSANYKTKTILRIFFAFYTWKQTKLLTVNNMQKKS